MTRQRVAPVAPAADPEPVLARTFSLPTARTFTLTGTARLSSAASDRTIDAQVGRPGAAGAVVAYSSQRLPGDLGATASAALDGNPATVWSPGLGTGNQVGAWIEVNRPTRSSVDHLNLQVVADGLHSVPTRLRVAACDRLAADGRCPADTPASDVAIPPVVDGRQAGTTVTVPVTFPAVTGKDLTVTVTGVRLETTPDYSFQGTTPPISLPIGIADLGIPDTRIGAPAATVPGGCRSDLLTIDGHPVPVALSGSTSAALQGEGLTVTPCGADAAGITLGSGSHVVLSAPGATTGIDIDQLALDSAPGGTASPRLVTAAAALAAPTPGPAPTVRVVSQTGTQIHLRVTGATHPYWLVLGQSINKGWKATVDATARPRARLAHRRLRQRLARAAGRGRHHGGDAAMDAPVEGERCLARLGPGRAGLLRPGLGTAPPPGRDPAPSMAASGSGAAPPSLDGLDIGNDGDVPALGNPFGAARPVAPGWAAITGAVSGLGAGELLPRRFLRRVRGGPRGRRPGPVVPRGRAGSWAWPSWLGDRRLVYTVALQATSTSPRRSVDHALRAGQRLVWVAIVFLAADAVVELVRRPRR